MILRILTLQIITVISLSAQTSDIYLGPFESGKNSIEHIVKWEYDPTGQCDTLDYEFILDSDLTNMPEGLNFMVRVDNYFPYDALVYHGDSTISPGDTLIFEQNETFKHIHSNRRVTIWFRWLFGGTAINFGEEYPCAVIWSGSFEDCPNEFLLINAPIGDTCNVEQLSSSKEVVKKEMNVYPNPTFDNLIVESQLGFDKYYIYDNKGKLRLSGVGKNVPIFEINTFHLENGIFFLKLISDDQVLTSTFCKL